MQNLKAKIIEHETLANKKIVYMIQIRNETTNKFKRIKLRYSQIREIHDQLVATIMKLKLNYHLPQFPGRKLFGSTNSSEDSIGQRKKELNMYLNQLVSKEKLYNIDAFKKYYLPDSEVVGESQQIQANQMNMQICIDRYTLIDETVFYYVRLRDLNSHEEWTYKARYSQLRNVHESLLDNKVKNLPPFPKKKIFGMTNESPQDIEKRRSELEKYFNEIFDVKQIMNSEAVKFFVEQSKKQAQKEKYLEALRKKKQEA